MSQLYLIRHAQASFLAKNYDQLSEKGIQQAQILGEYFVKKDVKFDRIYVGPLKRQIQTYEQVKAVYQKNGLECPDYIRVEALKEYEGLDSMSLVQDQLAAHHSNFKQWIAEMKLKPNHKTKMKMVVNYLHLWATDTLGFKLPEGAQTFQEFRQIAELGLKTILQGNEKGKTVAAFSSGGCIAAMLGKIAGVQDHGKTMDFNLVMFNTAISEVLFSGNRLSLKNFNTLPHLQEDMITTM